MLIPDMKFYPTCPSITYIIDMVLTPANTSKFMSNPSPPVPTVVNFLIFLVKEKERKKRPHFVLDFSNSLSVRFFGC